MATKPRYKNFGSTAVIDDFEPLSFALNEQDFLCRPALPGSVLLDLVKRADGASGAMAAEAVLQFLTMAIDESDRSKWDDLLADPDRIVQMETLGEIAGWLVEQYTARPTKGRSRSSGGRSNGGRTSTDTSSDEE